jgi:hypothetical protein
MRRDPLRIAVITVGVFLAGVAAASDGKSPAPSAEEIAVCTPDALRLCIPQVGFDRARVFSCMRAYKRRLSAGCRAVFLRHGL